MTSNRSLLAIVEGFRRPRDDQAHGTYQAGFQLCRAISQLDRYSELHVYCDRQRQGGGVLELPEAVPTRVVEKLHLSSTKEPYAAIYVSNGEQVFAAPHFLRPQHDWVPLICSVGTAHAPGQWTNLFLSLAAGVQRRTDGWVFKSKAALRLFQETWGDWCARFGFVPSFPIQSTVIPNGVDTAINRRSEALRAQTRRRLRLGAKDVLFLAFSRLSPGTKGDFQALVVRWKEVISSVPDAVLALAGAVVDHAFVADLRHLVQAAGVGNHVRIMDDPVSHQNDARFRLMSAADVFVHLSTGIEETSSLVVHEAMAHSLPVIATAWAGLPEIIDDRKTGFLVDTYAAPVTPYVLNTVFGQGDRTHALYSSKLVAIDWARFVEAAVLLGDSESRHLMGSLARRRAENHNLDRVARDYVTFFDECGRAAEMAWKPAEPARPLVSLDHVLRAQSRALLDPDQPVQLGDLSKVAFVSAGLHPENSVQIERVLQGFPPDRPVSIADVATLAVTGELNAGRDAALAHYRSSARFIVRLLNIGILTLAAN